MPDLNQYLPTVHSSESPPSRFYESNSKRSHIRQMKTGEWIKLNSKEINSWRSAAHQTGCKVKTYRCSEDEYVLIKK